MHLAALLLAELKPDTIVRVFCNVYGQAEIRIRPPASYDVGKPAHVTLNLLNDFLNFHETGRAGRTLTYVLRSSR